MSLSTVIDHHWLLMIRILISYELNCWPTWWEVTGRKLILSFWFVHELSRWSDQIMRRVEAANDNLTHNVQEIKTNIWLTFLWDIQTELLYITFCCSCGPDINLMWSSRLDVYYSPVHAPGAETSIKLLIEAPLTLDLFSLISLYLLPLQLYCINSFCDLRDFLQDWSYYLLKNLRDTQQANNHSFTYTVSSCCRRLQSSCCFWMRWRKFDVWLSVGNRLNYILTTTWENTCSISVLFDLPDWRRCTI